MSDPIPRNTRAPDESPTYTGMPFTVADLEASLERWRTLDIHAYQLRAMQAIFGEPQIVRLKWTTPVIPRKYAGGNILRLHMYQRRKRKHGERRGLRRNNAVYKTVADVRFVIPPWGGIDDEDRY